MQKSKKSNIQLNVVVFIAAIAIPVALIIPMLF